jgi:hypothetical protein
MKQIKPKIMVNNELLSSIQDIEKHREKLELYEKFKTKDLLVWLYLSEHITEQVLDKYLNSTYVNFYIYRDLLKIININDKISTDIKNFEFLINKFNDNEIFSLKELYTILSDILSYELLVNEENQYSKIKSIVLKNMDSYLMTAIILQNKRSGFSKSYLNSIEHIIANNKPKVRTFELFESIVIKSETVKDIDIYDKVIVFDSYNINITTLTNKKYDYKQNRLVHQYQIMKDIKITINKDGGYVNYIGVENYD